MSVSKHLFLLTLVTAFALVLQLFPPLSIKVAYFPTFVFGTFQDAFRLIPLACAAALIIAAGDIDLSVSGQMSLYGLILVFCVNAFPSLRIYGCELQPFASIALIFVAAILIGSLQGFLVAYVSLSSLIVTLAVAFVLSGVSVLLYSLIGSGVRSTISPDQWTLLFHQKISILWACVLVLAFCHWRGTLAGRRYLAIGENRAGAYNVGMIDIPRLRLLGFVVAACLVGLATCLYIQSWSGGWTPDAGRGKEILAITAAVIGGTSLSGGRLDPVTVSAAAVAVTAFQRLASTLPSSYILEPAFLGLCLLLYLGAAAVIEKRRRKKI